MINKDKKQQKQRQKENYHEGITWSEIGKQNAQPKKVYCKALVILFQWQELTKLQYL